MSSYYLIPSENCVMECPGGELFSLPPASVNPLTALDCYWYRVAGDAPQFATFISIEGATCRCYCPSVPEPSCAWLAGILAFVVLRRLRKANRPG